MNWDDFRIVLAVSRAGTQAGAARMLRVDATTVGRRIAVIEEALGARLFDRLSSGYIPTDVGHRAIERAESVEREIQSVRDEIEGTDQRVEGPVRLTGLDAIFDHLVIPRLPRLLDLHPGLEITFASNLDLVDLSRREADIALRSREPQHPDSVGRKLGRLSQAAYGAKGFQPGDRPPLIGLPREYEASAFSALLLEHFPNGYIAARGNSEGHIRALVKAGVGIGVLDCFAGDPDPGLTRVVPDPVWTQTAWAEVHIAMAKAPRIRAVTDFLRDVFAEEADLLAGDYARSRH
jgi:DNA-binding transcriptional LysR family regulator